MRITDEIKRLDELMSIAISLNENSSNFVTFLMERVSADKLDEVLEEFIKYSKKDMTLLSQLNETK